MYTEDMKNKIDRIGFEIDPEIKKKLKMYALVNGKESISQVIRELINRLLKEQK